MGRTSRIQDLEWASTVLIVTIGLGSPTTLLQTAEQGWVLLCKRDLNLLGISWRRAGRLLGTLVQKRARGITSHLSLPRWSHLILIGATSQMKMTLIWANTDLIRLRMDLPWPPFRRIELTKMGCSKCSCKTGALTQRRTQWWKTGVPTRKR